MHLKVSSTNTTSNSSSTSSTTTASQSESLDQSANIGTELPWRFTTGSGGGYLYGWSTPDLAYRLGRARGLDLPVPIRVGGVLLRKGVSLVAASSHSLALTLDGQIFSWGTNWDNGHTVAEQLGRKVDGKQMGSSSYWQPSWVEGIPGNVVHLAAGSFHSLAVTDDGSIFSWGLNDHGQLGREEISLSECAKPTNISLLRARFGHTTHIATACAARSYSLAATQDGRLFTWGLNFLSPNVSQALLQTTLLKEKGGASHDSAPGFMAMPSVLKVAVEPRPIGGGLQGKKVVNVSCADTHWVALTDEGEVYSASTGFNVPGTDLLARNYSSLWLGRQEGVRINEPGRVLGILSSSHAIEVAAATNATFAVTELNVLLSWGVPGPILGRQLDAAGKSKEMIAASAASPAPVSGSTQGRTIVQVAASHGFAIARDAEGWVHSWGNNRHLGHSVPDLEAHAMPAVVPGLDHLEATDVCAGSLHALVIVQPKDGKQGEEVVLKGEDAAKVDSVGTGMSHPQQENEENKERSKLEAHKQGEVGEKLQAGVHARNNGGMRVGDTQQQLLEHWQKEQVQQQQQPHVQEHQKAAAISAGASSSFTGTASSSTSYSLPMIKNASQVEDILETAADILSVVPSIGYNRAFKNPCWFVVGKGNVERKRLLCLPYFFILGAARCATQDLFARLALTGYVAEPKIREPEWWDMRGDKDFGWYVDQFSLAVEQISSSPNSVITGDATKSLLVNADMIVRGVPRDQKSFNLPELIHAFLPKAKLVIVLRNPADRSYSAFQLQMATSGMDIQSSFAKHVDAALPALRGCIAAKSTHVCFRELFHSVPDITHSLYVYSVKDWLTVFPRDQLLFIRFEDYVNNTENSMQSVLKFLGIPEPSQEAWDRALSMPIYNQAHVQVEPIEQRTRGILEMFFQPFNKKLAALIGDERFLW